MRKSILVVVVLLLVPLSGCTGIPRLIRASIILPDQAANGAAKIVEGLGQGLSGDYVPPPTVTFTPQQTVTYMPQQTELIYYYNQPMYSSPPITPEYRFDYWYLQPDNSVVFFTGSQHRRHSYPHGGNYNGHTIQHQGQNYQNQNYNRSDGRRHVQNNRYQKGDHHLSDKERKEARERAKKNRHD